MKPETFDHASIVKAWLDEPAWLPDSDLGRIARLVHQTPQQRRWPPMLDRRSFNAMSMATKFMLGGAFVALVGGYVLSGAVQPSPEQPLPPGAELATHPPVVANESTAPSPGPAAGSGCRAQPVNHLVMGPPSGATLGGWTEIGRLPMGSEDGIDDHGELHQLNVVGDRLVVLGRSGSVEGQMIDGIFCSTDGLAWEPALFRGNPRFTDLARTADGLLASGSIRGEDRREARLWSSKDGTTWTEVPAPPGPSVDQIVSAEAPRAVRVRNRLWVNRDGTTWERGTRLVNSLMQRGPGGFLTVHNIGTGSPPMLTFSEDLTATVEVAGAPEALEQGDAAFYGVVVFPLADQWVMISNQVTTPDVIWTSPEGLTWTEAPRPVGMTDEYVRWIANVGDEVQAFGNLMTDEGTPTGLWSWQLGEEASGLPLDESGDVFINEPVAFGDGYVATGLDRGRNSAITVWRYEPPATS